MEIQTLRRRVRYILIFFAVSLIVSGLTAVPLTLESELLQVTVGEGTAIGRAWPAMARWVSTVHQGIREMKQEQPFIFYGTDWLAFGHVVIGIFFLKALRDPAKSIPIIESGMIACALVIPWAMIFGPMRGIPFFWRLCDCAFGVFGIIPLWIARRYVRQIISLEQDAS